VVETTEAGKTNALNIADALVCAFPRFYLDADVILAPGDLARLARHLERQEAEIVSPRIAWDLSGVPPISREMARTWLALPYAGHAAFQIVIGLSRAGRARWERFPRILGDDVFMAAMIPPERRRIVDEVRVFTRPPTRFDSWVRTRTRWRRGERELLRMGLPLPNVPGQRSRLLRRLANPRTMLGAACFLAARLLGDLCSRLPGRECLSWRPERSTGVSWRPVPSD
jgi:hypothetical protein